MKKATQSRKNKSHPTKMFAVQYNILPVLQIYIFLSPLFTPGSPHIPQPNIVLFAADDFGYGDLSAYGHPTQEWGPIDRLAAEGVRFTQFYSVATFCTPSRASMMTGRLPLRSGMIGGTFVHLPCHNTGLPHSEITVAEALRNTGYATGIVGKWHLGINSFSHDDGSFLPHTQGFSYTGHILPHTLVWDCDTSKRHRSKPKTSKCFLYKNSTIVQQPINFHNLSATFLMDAKAFIYDSQEQPFFLYYSFAQTHTPMYAAPQFSGSSKRGMYGDQVNEMAWAVDEVLDVLSELRLNERTLVLFVSDHGPHLEMCTEGGSAGHFRGGKASFYEGGIRVPAIARWQGTLPPGQVSPTVLTLMDLFPTLLELAGGRLPKDRVIDGRSFAGLLHQQVSSWSTSTIHDILFFYCGDGVLQAVRYLQYKVYFKLSNSNTQQAYQRNCDGAGSPRYDHYHSLCMHSVPVSPPRVYNVEQDPGENFPLSTDDMEYVLQEVYRLVEEHEKTLQDLKPPILENKHCDRRLIPCCNPPYCMCS